MTDQNSNNIWMQLLHLLRDWLFGLNAKVEIKSGEYGKSISVEVGG